MPVPKKRTLSQPDPAKGESAEDKMPEEQAFRKSLRALAVQEVATELAGIWKQEKEEDAHLNLAAFKAKYQKRYPEAIRSLREDEEHLLTFSAFPLVMPRSIGSPNAIESFFSNVRQRTDQIDAFTTETSCLAIVWAVMQDIHLPRIPVS
jgi:putative transposase